MKTCDLAAQQARVDRLEQEVDGASLVAAEEPHRLRGVGGDEDDRHVTGALGAAHQLGELEAVHRRASARRAARARRLVPKQQLERFGCRSTPKQAHPGLVEQARPGPRGSPARSSTAAPNARYRRGVDRPRAGWSLTSCQPPSTSPVRERVSHGLAVSAMACGASASAACGMSGTAPSLASCTQVVATLASRIAADPRRRRRWRRTAVRRPPARRTPRPPSRTARRSTAANSAPGRRPTARGFRRSRAADDSRAGRRRRWPGRAGILSSASQTSQARRTSASAGTSALCTLGWQVHDRPPRARQAAPAAVSSTARSASSAPADPPIATTAATSAARRAEGTVHRSR